MMKGLLVGTMINHHHSVQLYVRPMYAAVTSVCIKAIARSWQGRPTPCVINMIRTNGPSGNEAWLNVSEEVFFPRTHTCVSALSHEHLLDTRTLELLHGCAGVCAKIRYDIIGYCGNFRSCGRRQMQTARGKAGCCMWLVLGL